MIIEFVSRIIRAVFPTASASSAGTVPRSPEGSEAAIARIEQILRLESGAPYPETSRTPYQPEPNEDGLIVVDGEGVDPNRPPPMPPGPPPL